MKILIQTPLDIDNILILQQELSMKINELESDSVVFSPSIFIDKEDIDEGMGINRVFSITEEIKRDPTMIPWIDSIKNKIYIGPAPKNVKFDCIYTIDKNTLSTQESFLELEDYFIGFSIADYYTAEDSDEIFDTKEEFIEYIKERL